MKIVSAWSLETTDITKCCVFFRPLHHLQMCFCGSLCLQFFFSNWKACSQVWAEYSPVRLITVHLLSFLPTVTSSTHTSKLVSLADIHAHAITLTPPCLADTVDQIMSYCSPSLTFLLPKVHFGFICPKNLLQKCAGCFGCFLAKPNVDGCLALEPNQ